MTVIVIVIVIGIFIVMVCQCDSDSNVAAFGNHGRKRSFTSVLRGQLTPSLHRGSVRLDSKLPYVYALVVGAAGCLPTHVVDLPSLLEEHPMGLYTGGWPEDLMAITLADLRTGKGHTRKKKIKASDLMVEHNSSPKWSGTIGVLH